MSTERTLVPFDLTRADIPPLAGHDWTRETPLAESMAYQDLRIGPIADRDRFQEVWTLACLMIENANPGTHAATNDHEYDADGHVTACTVTVIPSLEPATVP